MARSVIAPLDIAPLEQEYVDLLERDAVLGNAVESRLPYKRHVTGIGGLKSP
jgi:hypothetical protein